MYISILGRQPEISLAELEKVFGDKNIRLASDEAVIINQSKTPDISQLGGSIKIGRIIDEISFNKDWNKSIKYLVDYYIKEWGEADHKITLGLSLYGEDRSERDIQKIGILIKQGLKKKNISLRLIPNKTKALSSAVSHHNKLGLSLNKVELIILRAKSNEIIVAQSIGAQNITAYAKRDQGRPKRDAFVGMLPPKLAQIMINLAIGNTKNKTKKAILDPFCGTGVLLQEAALMGFDVIGTDISQKMIDYSEENLKWLEKKYDINISKSLNIGDATEIRWTKTIDAVISETYLGQPFSAPPSDDKLNEIKRNCSRIILNFLQNLHSQIESGTPICIAVPAWINKDGKLIRLQVDSSINNMGYKMDRFKNISKPLIYRRENQIVARELLVFKKV